MSRQSTSEIASVFERLELYVSAGVPVDASLDLLSSQYAGRASVALKKTAKGVRSGRRLADMLQMEIGAPRLAVHLISHGERAGSLAASLGSASRLLRRQEELMRACVSALVYPVVIGLASCALVAGLLRGVLPQIIPMLLSLHVPLPPLTTFVIWLSGAIETYGAYALICIIILAIAVSTAYKKSLSIRTVFQCILGYVPFVGFVVERYNMSIFMRSCGTMILAGVSSVDSFVSATKGIGFTPLKRRLHACEAGVLRGSPLGRALTDAHFPRDVAGIIHVGEMSGRLGDSLVRSAECVDRDVEHILRRATSLIEPIMMIAMGIVVGCIALSIMMPIYDISRVMQK